MIEFLSTTADADYTGTIGCCRHRRGPADARRGTGDKDGTPFDLKEAVGVSHQR